MTPHTSPPTRENVPNFGFITHASIIVSKITSFAQVQLFFLIKKIELKLLGGQTLFISDTGSNFVSHSEASVMMDPSE